MSRGSGSFGYPVAGVIVWRRREGNGRQDGKKQGVGRNMEIEIDQAMAEKGGYSRKGTQGRASDQATGILELFESVAVEGETDEEQKRRQEPSQFGRELKIVVVSVQESTPKPGRLILGEHEGECAGAGSE